MSKIILPAIAIAISVAIFLCKNLLPAFFRRGEGIDAGWDKIIVELMYFPVEIISIAIGCTLPKTISSIQIWFGWQPSDLISAPVEYATSVAEAKGITMINLIITVLAIFVLPFFVAIAKNAERSFSVKEKRWIVFVFIESIMALGILILSLKWGI